MWAYEGRVYPWVLNVGIYTGPVCEESGALVTQLSEPPIPGLSLRAASQSMYLIV